MQARNRDSGWGVEQVKDAAGAGLGGPAGALLAEAGLCEPITAAEFAGLVAEYSRSLRQSLPAFLTELDGFRSGLRMDNEWNDLAALAELPEAFVAFYWYTTA